MSDYDGVIEEEPDVIIDEDDFDDLDEEEGVIEEEEIETIDN